MGIDLLSFSYHKTPPEPSFDFEVVCHLLCEGTICNIRCLQPLAELRHSKDTFVGHPAENPTSDR